jgi:predicted MFS family arabinose efflux permease
VEQALLPPPFPKDFRLSFVLPSNAVEAAATKPALFTPYQVFLITVLAFLQFTVILDFMVMAPMGAILMPVLHIGPDRFGHLVSAYAFAAGISGLLTAGFADKFDRKKLLLVFYTGFILGTLFCGLAPSYGTLLAARIATGVFGGVIASITMAIVTDAFALSVRGRVMGYVQMAFALSQALGIPFALKLTNHFDWHAPFLVIVVFGAVAGLVILAFVRPVTEHLHMHHDTDPVKHLMRTFLDPRHRMAFLTMVILATGGFMMMPFSSDFLVNNVGIPKADLWLVFLFVGICSMFTFPIVGRLSDRFGRLPVFAIGTFIAITMTIIYSRLGLSPLWLVVVVNVVSFVGISSRIVSSQALMSAIPDPRDRGAFMSITSSIQQVSGGVAAWIAGLIVVQTTETAPLQHYDTLALVCAGTMLTCILFMFLVDKQVKQRPSAPVQAMRA